MKMISCSRRAPLFRLPVLCFALAVSSVMLCGVVVAGEAPKESSDGGPLVPLDIKLPAPAFKGTPKEMKIGPNVEPLSDKPGPAMMVPAGLKNIAAGKKMTSSDPNAGPDVIEKITDGDKEPSDQSIIYLKKGPQYVQMDLDILWPFL